MTYYMAIAASRASCYQGSLLYVGVVLTLGMVMTAVVERDTTQLVGLATPLALVVGLLGLSTTQGDRTWS